jgi:oxaloacetate decarboxylase
MSSRWSARRERFRGILTGSTCVHPASVHDAISARIAADLGFEAAMLAGSVASLAVLGAPDLIVLTLGELAEQAYRISRGADLPLLVDADHGYGNALNVMRTVEELEASGVAGLSIEDTELPQPYGASGKARLISIEEGVDKMRAALAARADNNLVIAGRTSAAAVTGIDDAIARARAYERAGVDALFFVGVKSPAQLAQIAAEVRLPIILGGLPEAMMDRAALASRGVRICLQGHQPFQAAVRAMHDTLKALRDGTPPSALPDLASPDLMRAVTRAADYDAWTRDFLDKS